MQHIFYSKQLFSSPVPTVKQSLCRAFSLQGTITKIWTPSCNLHLKFKLFFKLKLNSTPKAVISPVLQRIAHLFMLQLPSCAPLALIVGCYSPALPCCRSLLPQTLWNPSRKLASGSPQETAASNPSRFLSIIRVQPDSQDNVTPQVQPGSSPNSSDEYLKSSQHKPTLVQSFIISHLLATAITETTDIHILQVP